MRRELVPLLGVLALSLACINGGQPDVYKIAIDFSPLEALPGSCYTTGVPPATPPQVSGLFADREWTLWEGADNRRYLDIAALTVPLGNAGNVSFTGMIEGGPKEWRVERKTFPAAGETDTRSFTITFTDIGFTVEGSVVANSTYECAGCGRPSCQATLPFNGRRIETQRISSYGG